jgi:septum formation protein
MKSIVLASTSPRRKVLLKQLGLKFSVVNSGLDERFNPRLKPRGQAEVLSLQKAELVANRYREKGEGGVIIITADTIVEIGGEVLGKPKDEREAKRMLNKLSGKAHSVITGFTIIDVDLGRVRTASVETVVHFRRLRTSEMGEFVKRERVVGDKAGAYAVQGVGAIFIERIEGDYFNIVGLPLYELALELRKFGVEVL